MSVPPLTFLFDSPSGTSASWVQVGVVDGVLPEPGLVVALGGVDGAVAVTGADRALVGRLGFDAQRHRRQRVQVRVTGS